MPAESSSVQARLDPELSAEQEHLAQSRAALGTMRERTAAMTALSGDRVSAEALAHALAVRVKSLEDSEVPLFFGRLDYGAAADHAEDAVGLPGERFYIGRRHVTDERGDPLVVDWRAPVSRPFYRASRTEPYGLRLRRRFGFHAGVVTAYEDEQLSADDAAADDRPDHRPSSADDTTDTGPALHSAILEAEIERPRVGPMRDIVATIQPEQDVIVRAGLATSVCVQGAPGTGKTAVGLHRAAYLLYAYRDQLTRQGVLVVGPNDSFLKYIADVLPALGEIDARQTTVEQLVGHVPVTVEDHPEAARVKADARMAEVVRRAVWTSLTAATEALTVPLGARRWRVPAYEADELVAELRSRGIRYGAGRAMLPQRLAHAILVKMELSGDSPDDRVQNAVARSRPVRQYADALWPALDATRLVMRLLGEPDFLRTAAAGVLTDTEQASLSWDKPARGVKSARWSLHDAVLVDEARDLVERTPSLGHVVLDEAQDLSPMMLRCVGRQCSTGSSTVLGDLAQATTAWSVGDWDETLTHLGQPDAHVEELTVGFRVPGSVLSYATRLLPLIAPSLTPPTSVRRATGELVITRTPDPLAAAARAVSSLLANPGSIGLIVPDSWLEQSARELATAGITFGTLGGDDDIDARVDLVPATLAKGLEFDHVVLVEPAEIAAAESDEVTGLRRLYVCLTRAVTSLVVLHADDLPTALTERPA